MALTEIQRYQLKKFIKELSSHKARHTELISVYIPQDYDMNKIINHLQQEQGTATNIKDATTRKNVIDALERMVQHLRLFKRTPPNGLAVFSGNIAAREGQQDFNVWSIEPPVALKTRIYRCDKEFVLDLLEEMLETKEIYGLVVMDRREGDIAYLKGKTIVPITRTKSNVPGKTRAGGQSAKRYEHLREDAAKAFYKKIGELMKGEFLGKKELKGIIIGGPGPTKYDFVNGGYITNEVRKKIIAIKDLGYTGEFGFEELVDKSQDVLAAEEVTAEKEIMNRFFELLSKKPNMVVYGEEETMKKLRMGAVDVLLLSESLGDKEIESFEKEAKLVASEVRIVSIETREGVQLKDFGKVAAILRYEVE